MKRIWAPWRLEYIKGKKEKGCIFCACPKKKNAKQALVLAKNPLTYDILNKYPYTNGHLMVVPYRHIDKIEDLTSEEGLEIFNVVQEVSRILKKVFHPQGFNVGMNVGKAAGAGIESHLHMHVVPRWRGDHNFMPAVGSVKVMPISLEKTYQLLAPYFLTSKK